MSTYRHKLDNVYKTLTQSSENTYATHAGLWLDRYIEKQDRESVDSRSGLIKYATTLPMPEIYRAFYTRWEEVLKAQGNKVQARKAAVKGRMIIGLGDESILETSIVLHHTYGVPYIPGSALKGLAASYARQKLTEQEWQVKGEVYGEAYKVVFGDTNNAGYITFLDAFYVPDSGYQKRALYPDVITVHHKDYYQDKDNAPADWDSPTPIPFVSATGSYLIALAAPDLEQSTVWLTRTFEIVEHALKDMGIGAKTSSGYGRMELEQLTEKAIQTNYVRPNIPTFRIGQEVTPSTVVAPTDEMRRNAPADTKAFLRFREFPTQYVLIVVNAEEATNWKPGERRGCLFQKEEAHNGCTVIVCQPKIKK